MRVEVLKKYKNFTSGVIFADFWLEWNTKPFSEDTWRFNFRLILINFVIFDISIARKLVK